ncbi:MAG: response regulator [Oligoflexales bacterium]
MGEIGRMHKNEKSTVLIVDDEKEILEMVEMMLIDEHQCFQSDSVEDALKIIAKNKIDVVLTDLNMPNKGGADLLKVIKKDHSDIPVIVMTGFASKESAMKIANLGAHEIVEKPLNPGSLKLSIKRALLVRKTIEDQYNLMVARFCHEISTPITGILMLAQLLSSKLNTLQAKNMVEEKQVHQSNRILVLGKRVRDMIRMSKQALVNQDSSNDDQNNLFDIVSESIMICDYAGLLEKVKIDHDKIGRNISINGSVIKISQVFINLFKNAIQANKENENSWIKVSTEIDGPYVNISVTDSGTGIPRDIATKIFAETFTTKSFDDGTGLGLNICRTIVENHGGVLMLDNNATNTTFVVKLLLS